jgi:CBS-domain-containing membrane protein
MKVSEVMRVDVKTISVDASVGDAVAALAEAREAALPVIDRFGRAVGAVAAQDILRAAVKHDSPVTRARLFEETGVLEVMNAWPMTVSPEEDLLEAAAEMVHSGAQRLIVERDGALAGMITPMDIIRALAADHATATAA